MKLPRPPHAWSLTPRRAIALQKEMAALVLQRKPPGEVRLVAGLDAAFSRDDRLCIAGVVLWGLRERQLREQHTAVRVLRFPYIPGLLSFREIPALLAALRKLRHPPDALMCDGQGLAHPRRFGIACHLGVLCNLPSIGCAKSRLIGEHTEPGRRRGARVPLLDKDEIVGTVLRTQTGVRPLYVSVGHHIDLPGAEEIVLECATQFRLPEPTRLADILVAAEKQERLRRSIGGRSANTPRDRIRSPR